MTRILILLLTFCAVHIRVHGQSDPGGQVSFVAVNNTGILFGKIIDELTEKPIEKVSVEFLYRRYDPSTKKDNQVLLSSMVTDKRGEFYCEQIPLTGIITLQVSSVGYSTIVTKFSFENPANLNEAGVNDYSHSTFKDLGNIKLKADGKQLDSITVTSTRPLLEMYLDKKVYNVERDISVTGGTAADVMRNVPSVSVDIDGNLSIRNSSPQLFVDGRPTTLTLNQIPADQIASVEIITNPSAKYDAGGSGAAILNIVLKKNRKPGYNGNLRTNIDKYGRPAFGADINIRKNKVNFFGGGQLNFRKNMTRSESKRQEFPGGGMVSITQKNSPVVKGYLAFARMGMDYFVDNRTTLTIAGNYFNANYSLADQLFSYRDSIKPSSIVSESSIRNMGADIKMENKALGAGFKHNFPKEGRELSADVNFSENTNSNTSDYSSRYYDGNGNMKPPVGAERATGAGKINQYTFQADYKNSPGLQKTLETGLRVAARDYTSWNDNYLQNLSTNLYVLIPAITVNYTFKDIVFAAYGTYSQRIKKLNYQLGLRAEASNYKGNLSNKNLQFANNYPFSLFPSLFVTYELSPSQTMQFNYSRKIGRPGFFQILPFVDFSDSLNLSVGNPALMPEFTHLTEISYLNQYTPGHSFNSTLYAKLTDNLITRYQYKAANTNPAAKPDTVIYNSFGNADYSYTIGIELTSRNKIVKIWDITSNINLFDVTLKNIAGNADKHQFSWFAKLANNFLLPKSYSIQVYADYQARTILPVNSGRGSNGVVSTSPYGVTQNIAQGYIKPVYGADIAVKKDFLKNNVASVSVQFSDIFRTRTYETYASTGDFIQDNYRQRDPQFVRLNLNWRFGKSDITLLKRKNLKVENEGLQGL